MVSGSFQGFDHTYLIHALKSLGDGFVGVVNIQPEISSKKLLELKNSGVVGARFNLKRGSFTKLTEIESLSTRLFEEFEWHSEFYLDSKDLKEILPTLCKIPSCSIDHLGLSKSGLKHLYLLVEKGVKVKATGFGRLDFDPVSAMKTIHSINPKSLMFGSDLPSTRSKTPFSQNDINRIMDSFNQEDQELIFHKNATNWYLK